ncbi:MAG: 16S rRNA (adenine(1518)-N(6)/adenine(1519)-N(6))-dimethyltransferase RsmA [Gammaproteobacteria bacterium]|nr:16S rRNA (adenine(1518)-N(6)/adenine(1519)-N(6))-dimethyltransferase RsmA [Gammaproteobacteria bacterium]
MNHRPRKRFGQNFLHDPGVIQNIISAIAPAPGKRIVEIGPGLGALTSHLLKQAGVLDVVELDRDLIPYLETELSTLGELHIHNADALKFDFCALAKAKTSEKLHVVGNLPYNISTPLLFHLLDQKHCIQDMHFMLQNEVVNRLAAKPGGKEYGRLSVMVQFHCKVDKLFIVPPGAFNPPPKVNSAVVRLVPYLQAPVEVNDSDTFSLVVMKAFGQRRKTLRNNLKGLLNADLIQDCGIDPIRRGETLSLDEFAALANAIAPARE